MNKNIIALLLALVAPLPLVLVETVLPFPYIIEEIIKLMLVVVLLSGTHTKRAFLWVMTMAVFFSLSESVFYLTNYLALGVPERFYIRLLVTGSMHLLTFILFYVAFLPKKPWILLIAGMVACLVHLVFNALI